MTLTSTLFLIKAKNGKVCKARWDQNSHCKFSLQKSIKYYDTAKLILQTKKGSWPLEECQ